VPLMLPRVVPANAGIHTPRLYRFGNMVDDFA
jgi:hypothetical protein